MQILKFICQLCLTYPNSYKELIKVDVTISISIKKSQESLQTIKPTLKKLNLHQLQPLKGYIQHLGVQCRIPKGRIFCYHRDCQNV